RTNLNLTGLNHNTEYVLYIAGQQTDGLYTTIYSKEFKTNLINKFAAIEKGYSSVLAYFIYPSNLASTSVIKYATPNIFMYNYYGGDDNQEQWFNVEGGKNILTQDSEIKAPILDNQTITAGEPLYFMFGEYTKSGDNYTPNFGTANPGGYLYKELVIAEKPETLAGKTTIDIVVRPSGKGSITITPHKTVKSFYYMLLSEEEYNNVVRLLNNNATYMQWFVSSPIAESLFGSKKAQGDLVIDTSTFGLKQSTKYYFLMNTWGDDKGEQQSFYTKEFKLPPAAPAKATNIVVAHRGGSAEAGKKYTPDNSIASLRYAKSLKCYGVETDIYWTKDNRIIVIHADGEIKINGKYPWEHTLEELRRNYKLSNGETVPTLEEYIAEAMTEGSCTRLWLDLKPCNVSDAQPGHTYVANACRRASEIIKEMEAEQWVEFICTGHSVKYPVSYAKEAGIAIGAMGRSSVSTLKGYGYTWVNLDIGFINKGEEESKINSYVDAGMELSIFMIDDDATLETFAPYMNKLKGIVTNYPKKFVDKMKKD
ncbi:MAG: hypothetical protein IIX04_00035, partial [Alistipes sp.]|nr:hypothetical protein [Alistipes sp.]